MPENTQDLQASLDSIKIYIGTQVLTLIALQDRLMKANKAVEDLQQQLLKYQKEETT